jgi:beta-glucosidase
MLTACSSHRTEVTGDARVDGLLAQMTLAEKISMIHGEPEDRDTDQGQAGYLAGVARLGIPPMRLADGPPGVLTRYPATGLTATMGLAATFSVDDARQNGIVIGRDAKALGIDVVLEPYINMHRDQTFGRAYNTYGEDPLLTGTIGAALIAGVQSQGIMAQAKHFVGYDGADEVRIDPQALHEIYLAPFADAVTAGVASLMCSYNLINGAYSCGNRATLTIALREQMAFKGFVTSDWGAVHGTDFINAGLDLEMPGSGTVMTSYFQGRLPPPGTPRVQFGPLGSLGMPEEPPRVFPPPKTRPADPAPIGMETAVERKWVSAATITRAAGRILEQMHRFGLLDRQGPRPRSALAIEANAGIVRQTAEDAAVLLKNEAGALPLAPQDLTAIALIGPGAAQTIAIGESGEKALGHLERQIGPLAALGQLVGTSQARIRYAAADDMSGRPIPGANLSYAGRAGLARTDDRGGSAGVDRELNFTKANQKALPPGTRAHWSGALRISRAGSYRIYLQVLGASASLSLDGRAISRTSSLQLHGNILQPGQDNVLPTPDGLDNARCEIKLSAGMHVVTLEVAGDQSGEPVQVRLNWVTPEQHHADYAAAIAAARHARKAVVFAWSRGWPSFQLPGDQDRLIADIAAANPNTVVVLNLSEPVAMPWLDKVKAVLLMWFPGDEGGWATADLLLGRANPAGRLPFTWPKELAQSVANDPAHPERSSTGVDGVTNYSEGIFIGYRWFDQQRLAPLYEFGYGLSYTNFDYSNLVVHAADDGLKVDFDLRNSGAVVGDEVPQVYLGPPAPLPAGAQFAPRALAAFARVHLNAGESRHLQLHIAPRALQYWSAAEDKWVTAAGPRAIYIAASSRSARLQTTTSIIDSRTLQR